MSTTPDIERSDDLLAEQGHDYRAAEVKRAAHDAEEDAEVAAVKPGDDGEADTIPDEP